jgi:hypothetical protein
MSYWSLFYTLLYNTTTPVHAHDLRGWIIRVVSDPLNTFAYERGWTTYKPINELTIDELMGCI